MQEQRAQEDHQQVTEMHQLVLEEMAKHHEEIEDLKELIAMAQGKPHERQAAKPRQNLWELHPRGHQRFAMENGKKRLAQHLRGPNSHQASPQP